jgi:hypothetical protein
MNREIIKILRNFQLENRDSIERIYKELLKTKEEE